VSTLPLHTSIEGFSVRDNCLCVAGRKITDIVREAGGTPLYAYDRSLIEARVRKLRSALPDELKIHYAIKANPLPEIVQLMSQLVDGLDVASEGELNVAVTTNMPRSEISFAGPGKRVAEIDAAVIAGVVLNIESETELGRVKDAAQRLKQRAKVAVRVNPAFELKGSGMRMSGGPKPFGVDAERVPELLRQFDTSTLDFTGFHIFAGSQNLNAEAICESQRKSVELALELSAYAPSPPGSINIGGGFGIPYFPGDKPLDLTPIGAHLGDLVSQVKRAFSGCDLAIELGRYLVGEAGIYICEVVDRKVSRGQTFLITDGGLHHHLAASGNFGQVIRRNYPVLIGNRVYADTMEPTNIVGPLCTPLDILADKMMLPLAEIGDLVVVFQSGAYGFSASPRSFLGHPEPRETLLQ
jgi:diaminopimelate decarboxylase